MIEFYANAVVNAQQKEDTARLVLISAKSASMEAKRQYDAYVKQNRTKDIGQQYSVAFAKMDELKEQFNNACDELRRIREILESEF